MTRSEAKRNEVTRSGQTEIRDMQYWLTVHHPPEDDGESSEVSGIWVRRKRAEDFPQLAVGDLVLIYETKGGPSRILVSAGQEPRRSRYRRAGLGAIIAVGKVESIPPRQITRAVHDDGEEIEWVKLAVLSKTSLAHPVPLARLNSILGRQPKAVLRGFGGLRTVTATEFEAVLAEGKG